MKRLLAIFIVLFAPMAAQALELTDQWFCKTEMSVAIWSSGGESGEVISPLNETKYIIKYSEMHSRHAVYYSGCPEGFVCPPGGERKPIFLCEDRITDPMYPKSGFRVLFCERPSQWPTNKFFNLNLDTLEFIHSDADNWTIRDDDAFPNIRVGYCDKI